MKLTSKLMVMLISFYLCCLPVVAGAQQPAGSSRGYETDILRNTFEIRAKDIDADIDLFSLPFR